MTYAKTVEEFIEYEEAALRRAPATIVGHRRCLNIWGAVLDERKEDWRRPSRRTAEVALIRVAKRSRSGRPGSYQAMLHSTCNGFYKYGLQHEYVEANPWKDIDYPRYKAPEPDPLTYEEIGSLVEHADSQDSLFRTLRDRALIYALYSTGCRISEMIDLDLPQYRRVRDPDIDADYRARVHGKGDKERDVYFIGKAVEAIECYLHMRTRLPGREAAFWLETQRWKRMSTNAVRQALKRAAHRAGIFQRVNPHLLRHCFATHLVERGVDIEKVRVLLGHADLKTTTIYVHIAAKHAASAAMTRHPLAQIAATKEE